MHIALIGPATPSQLQDYLDPSIGSPPKGLGGVPVTELARALLDLGHRVSLFTVSTDVESVVRLQGALLEVVVVPYRARARARALDMFRAERRALADELRKCEAELFHAHWTYEFAMAAQDAAVGPLVITAHDAPLTVLRLLPDPYRLIRLFMAWRVRMRTQTLTAVSPYLAERWRRQMRYRRPVAIVPNIVPPILLPGGSSSPRPNSILDVTDASALKNVRNLLRAFAIVRERVHDAQLRLVGPGLGATDTMAAWAREKGLAHDVIFVGPVDRVSLAAEMISTAVLCHVSLEESQGIVLLEALAAGAPVIAGRDAGGTAWTLFDGRAGYLTDVRSPTLIADSICAVLDNPALTRASGFDVVRAVAGRYSAKAVAEGYLRAYRDALAHGVS